MNSCGWLPNRFYVQNGFLSSCCFGFETDQARWMKELVKENLREAQAGEAAALSNPPGNQALAKCEN
jgi:hypothetical protein